MSEPKAASYLITEGEAMDAVINTEFEPLRAHGELPQHPTLAPGVQLIGELPESGFKDRQWLIQRDGQFIQVTELLYRIAEQANGQRTLEEIAAEVTAATAWIVSPDNVRQLIQAKLVPLEIIGPSARTARAQHSAVRRSRSRSPLAFTVRLKVLSPRLIDPITGLLQGLYAPPILVPLLLLIVIAHLWLYAVHGITAGARQTFATPGLLLAVFAITAISGIVHEFGHAAALRYGGGQVRAMGVGLYLIYPALYTDTTDSYRLGRWAKVRTDLGGFYFHLLFALGLMALYFVSGYEFLLFVVVLINLDIFYQCLPFVRFDGYWALADLTGLPDFFSQMGGFVRSIAPLPGLPGNKLPKLKFWVKLVFVLYMLVTLPLLTYLYVLMVQHLPQFLMASWEAFRLQLGEFAQAERRNDVWTMLLSITQMLLLLPPVLGTAYLLYRSGRTLLRTVWNWSKPSAMRRIVGACVLAAVIVPVVFLWVPQLP